MEMGINPPQARARPDLRTRTWVPGTTQSRHRIGREKIQDMSDTTNQQDEFYDDATEAFPSVDDLAPLATNKNPDTTGRLVAIWALENGTAQGEKGPYSFTETITLVLDDGPDGDQATELVGAAPVELKLRHSTTGIQTRVGPRVEGMSKPKRDADGQIITPSVPLKFRPMIGRINTRAPKNYKNGNPAVSIAVPTDADREIARRYETEIRAINERLEANASKAEDAKAFE